MNRPEVAAHDATVAQSSGSVTLENVGRDFGTVQAVKSVTISFKPCEIHALVGENGAGKSTLLGILAGRVAPTRGTVTVFGEQLHGGNPREAKSAGVMAIYQELTMIPARAAYENVFLGQELHSAGRADDRAMKKRFRALCQEFGVSIRSDDRTDSLSVADQQLLEIMRALQSGAKVVLFDEPTAALADQERQKLFKLMDRLRSNGTAIGFVSHNLDEVLQISDHVSVFREGEMVASRPAIEWSKTALVRAMLGRELSSTIAHRPARPATEPRPVMKVSGLAVAGVLYPNDLTINAGEVLGVAGLVGSGRTSLLRALAGLERANGRIETDTGSHAAPRTARRARDLGVALVPEDRKRQGLVLRQSSALNVVLGDLGAVSKLGFISNRKMMAAAKECTIGYGFDPRRLGAPAAVLSGGNQQKLLLGRWRHAQPKILLADEPTRGIDLGAKSDILGALRQTAAEDGLAVVIVSSELEELLAVADRILVMRDGRIVAEHDNHGGSLGVEDLLRDAFGLSDPDSAESNQTSNDKEALA